MPPNITETTTAFTATVKLSFWERQIRNDVLEEAAKVADEQAKIFRSDEFALGGCLTSAVAARLVAGAIRAMTD